MMVGAYMFSSCGSIASTSRLPLMALLDMLLHTNRVGFSLEMQVKGRRRLACKCHACAIHLGDAVLARQHRQPARQRADHFGEVA